MPSDLITAFFSPLAITFASVSARRRLFFFFSIISPTLSQSTAAAVICFVVDDASRHRDRGAKETRKKREMREKQNEKVSPSFRLVSRPSSPRHRAVTSLQSPTTSNSATVIWPVTFRLFVSAFVSVFYLKASCRHKHSKALSSFFRFFPLLSHRSLHSAAKF